MLFRSNLEDIEAKRNGDWRLKRGQREIETIDKLERAERIGKRFGISIQEALLEMGKIGQANFTYKEQEDVGEEPQEVQSPESKGQSPKAGN